jgi:AAA domain/Relaxase/Mobilisation nuclease domain
MICKGKLYKSGASTAAYMTREKDGERVEVGQVRGFASEDIFEALSSVDVMAKATRGEKPVFHTSVRLPDGEQLTPEQWEYAADRVETKLGLSGQPRAIAFHIDTETGDRHMHVAWSRIDEETMTLREVPFYKMRLNEVSRELERELGLTQVRSERAGKTWAPTDEEADQGRRLGNDVDAIHETIRDCWDRSDNGRSFQVALEFEGLRLARGDRRDFILIDGEGGLHALSKRILGVSAAEIRDRCNDINRTSLPTVEQARAEQRTGMRDQHAANLAWEDAVADAAILKEKLTPQFDAAPRFSMDQYEQLTPAVLGEITRNRATFTRYDVQRALESRIENKLDREGLARSILGHPDVIRLDTGKGRVVRYTTPTVLESEGHALRGADAIAEHDWHGVPERLAAEKLSGLSGEKAEALQHILGPQGLAILDGQAGTGKSTVLAAGKDIYEADGCRVIGLAHTNLVVQDLKSKGFDARTIDSEMNSLANGRTQWTARTVVMVDEAAMVDTKRLGMVFAHAQASGAKVILAGDDRQLSSIERGGLFEVLKTRYGAAELTEVHRQHATDERGASQMMARGDFAGALAIYGGKGAIHWGEKQSEAAEALVNKYMQDSAADPRKTRFIFAYRNAEVDQINAVVREARNARFELGESSNFETKHGRAEFAPGDRIQFTGNDKQRGIYNGQAGTVKEIDGSRFIVELDGRKKATVAFDAGEFQDFRHGYAGTIYRGQGRTIDQTYLFHSEYWRNSSSYVALTRHSEKSELFVAREIAADLPELARQMSRLDERRAASYYAKDRDRQAAPLTPGRLAAWYANQANLARSFRDTATAGSVHGSIPSSEFTGRPRRTQAEPANSPGVPASEGIRLAFSSIARGADVGTGILGKSIARAFSQIANEITSLLAGDQPRSAEDVNRKLAANSARTEKAEADASQRRRYGREMDTQAREKAEAEAQEGENQRRRRTERQRW